VEKKKLDSIQVLRGIAAVAVVLFHLMAVEKKYSLGFKVLPDFFRIGQSGVDLFFVISGFIMALITYDNNKKTKSVNFLLKRICRIFPVYWFYTFITLCIFLAVPAWVNSSQGNNFNLLASVFLFPAKTLPLVMVGWSLVFEFYFYIVFSLLLLFSKKIKYIIIAVWALLLIIANIFYEPNHYLIAFFLSPYPLEFIFGIFCCEAFKRTRKGLPLWLLISSIIICLVLIFVCYQKFYGQLLIQSICFGLLYSSLLYSVVSLETFYNVLFPKILTRIGDSSYSIYLSHVLIISAAGRFFGKFFLSQSSIILGLLFFIITIALVIIYSFLSYQIIEKKSYTILSRYVDSGTKNFF